MNRYGAIRREHEPAFFGDKGATRKVLLSDGTLGDYVCKYCGSKNCVAFKKRYEPSTPKYSHLDMVCLATEQVIRYDCGKQRRMLVNM